MTIGAGIAITITTIVAMTATVATAGIAIDADAPGHLLRQAALRGRFCLRGDPHNGRLRVRFGG